jgi:hypothetical protein
VREIRSLLTGGVGTALPIRIGTGLIFTFVWALDDPQDRAFVDAAVATFANHGGRVYFVELEASQAERLRRDVTPLRLAEKWPQRDVAGSCAFLANADRTYRMNSDGAFFCPDRHLKIDNTALEPDVVAGRIVEHFSLTSAAADSPTVDFGD